MPGKMMMYREGGRVKKKPDTERPSMPAMPPIGKSVASGNRAQELNNMDLRGVRMIDEGPMSPNDLAAMRMYGKKGTKR